MSYTTWREIRMDDKFGQAIVRTLNNMGDDKERLALITVFLASSVLLEYDRLDWAVVDKERRN